MPFAAGIRDGIAGFETVDLAAEVPEVGAAFDVEDLRLEVVVLERSRREG